MASIGGEDEEEGFVGGFIVVVAHIVVVVAHVGNQIRASEVPSIRILRAISFQRAVAAEVRCWRQVPIEMIKVSVLRL